MPATVAVNDLLVVVIEVGSGTTSADSVITTPSGWSPLFPAVNHVLTTNNNRLGIYAKIADGTEGGTTVDFVTVGIIDASAYTWRITGMYLSALLADFILASATGDLNTNHPTPPNTTGWKGTDTLWIAVVGWLKGSLFSTYPPNYLSNQANESLSQTGLAEASRNLKAQAEAPSFFALSSAAHSVAALIAIRGQGGGLVDDFVVRRWWRGISS